MPDDGMRPGSRWRDRAACRDSEPEMFVPAAEAGAARARQVAAAKAVCARCPVRAECLAEALVRLPYGIAGGLTEHERRRLRARDRTRRDGLSAEAAELLTDGPGHGLSAGQRGRLVRELLADGRPVGRVATACRVSERTVQRWAARPADSTYRGGTGGRGATAATGLPSGSPTAIDAQAGTRAAEEGRE